MVVFGNLYFTDTVKVRYGISLLQIFHRICAGEKKANLPLPWDVEKLKSLISASCGLCLPDPWVWRWPGTASICPWTSLRAPPSDPCYRFALPRSPCN